MSKVSAGGGKQGKSGKSRSKGSGADIVSSRTESLATSRNTGVVTLLRKALRNDDGTERDLLAELPSFTKYARNGLDLAVLQLVELHALQLRFGRWEVNLHVLALAPISELG